MREEDRGEVYERHWRQWLGPETFPEEGIGSTIKKYEGLKGYHKNSAINVADIFGVREIHIPWILLLHLCHVSIPRGGPPCLMEETPEDQYLRGMIGGGIRLISPLHTSGVFQVPQTPGIL